MADIISIETKRGTLRAETESARRRRKIQAVQKILHCTHCSFKCEKCGEPVAACPQEQEEKDAAPVPYRFCEGCRSEYTDYIRCLQGRDDQDAYWHNQEWLEIWRSWIDYQSSVDRYARSREFLRLMHELKQPPTD